MKYEWEISPVSTMVFIADPSPMGTKLVKAAAIFIDPTEMQKKKE